MIKFKIQIILSIVLINSCESLKVLCSGGGIRAAMMCVLSKNVIPDGAVYQGLSGGAWGAYMLDKYGLDVIEKIENRYKKDSTWGPGFSATNAFNPSNWWDEVYENIMFSEGNDTPSNTMRTISTVARIFSKGGSPQYHCDHVGNYIECPGISINLDEFLVEVSNRSKDKLSILDILAMSSSAFNCIKSIARQLVFEGALKHKRTGEEWYFIDGGCYVNIPENPLDVMRDGGMEPLIIFDSSYYSDGKSAFDEMIRVANNMKNDWSQVLVALLEADQKCYKCFLDKGNCGNCVDKKVFHYIHQHENLNFIFSPLVGNKSGWSLMEKYPTMEGFPPQAKKWRQNEFTNFVHEWGEFLNEHRNEYLMALRKIKVDGRAIKTIDVNDEYIKRKEFIHANEHRKTEIIRDMSFKTEL